MEGHHVDKSAILAYIYKKVPNIYIISLCQTEKAFEVERA